MPLKTPRNCRLSRDSSSVAGPPSVVTVMIPWGPKGANNNPTGGNAFALLNAELRFDAGKGFGLVTFVDAGNVWRLVEDSGTELKYTAGAGIRYNTPVGPLRLDYGRKLKKEAGLSTGEVHFSFGHAF